MVADPRITPRDRELAAILRTRAADVDPVEYAAWIRRPEIQDVLDAMRELERRRDDQSRDNTIRFAIDALKATIEANKDLADPVRCAETRRAATTILHICTTLLRGLPCGPFAAPRSFDPRPPRTATHAAHAATAVQSPPAPRAPAAPSAPSAPRAPRPPANRGPDTAASPPSSLPDSALNPPLSASCASSALILSPSALDHRPPHEERQPHRNGRHSPSHLAAAAGLAGPAP